MKNGNLMRPMNGIDKIAVLLNPLFINRDFTEKHLDPLNVLTLSNAGVYKVLTINQEFFDTKKNYQEQIKLALIFLLSKGCFNFCDSFLSRYFVINCPEYLILGVTAVEFYFDWREDDIEVDDAMTSRTIDGAKDEGCMYRYCRNGEATDTYYSPNQKRHGKSSVCVYNKRKKDYHDRRIKFDRIKKHPYGTRLEFKIYKGNTNWLHWDNLRGTYLQILNRHLPLLAMYYNRYVRDCVDIKTDRNRMFRKIADFADGSYGERFRSKVLKKSDVKKKSSAISKNEAQKIMKNLSGGDNEKLSENDKKLYENFLKDMKTDGNVWFLDHIIHDK